ncbi:lipopolysaccharide biosynthesis protein [Peptostreptococcus equinus]|uniref:Polysaccharide biosynthesis C-terminal domain-containing protein n=1 Tax=Peptostreptococcus equinus TaxID=3003601 RepID=A0ABY7JPS0_9FIRM|nr:polysaccharide biosynthesis C-terminal domain-containing protein [Peptostreptococcus sp. CBA3647]WAW14153.1 polysaccharide biosynthesis C-terminal domain-containing protein [Peptostreptococcus sp. CBA3647]
MNRLKKLKLNLITSIINQFVNIISGFILPVLFLRYYGSEVNGLVASISQFLAVITLCECGVGAVVQAALYKPLAENNVKDLSIIYVASNKFFKKISYALCLYTLVLIFAFPTIINDSFSVLFTSIILIAIAISIMAQYYFALTYKLILSSAQMSYIQMIIGTITVILNVFISVILIKLGFGIHIVKLFASIVFLIQPFIYKKIVDTYFKIDYNIKYNLDPLKQKWSGFSQHIATVILENTDVIVLTIFSTLTNVSIYAIYHLVTNGIKILFTNFINIFKSVLGDMYARNEMKLLDVTFSYFEWIVHNLVVIVFTMTGILIVPFVSIYTKGVNDVSYNLPIFGILMSISMGIYTIRLPYSHMIMAAGHFRQTQFSAMIEAFLNVILSIILVSKFGLIGVAIGTIIAITYRAIYFIRYLSNNILQRSILLFFKQFTIDCMLVIVMYYTTKFIELESINYVGFVIMALKVGIISLVEAIIINFIFFKSYLIKTYNSVLKKKYSSDSIY